MAHTAAGKKDERLADEPEYGQERPCRQDRPKGIPSKSKKTGERQAITTVVALLANQDDEHNNKQVNS
jgi:hypothetical protein